MTQMALNEYHDHVLRTLQSGETIHEKLSLSALGLAGETGEVIDHIKKVLHHGWKLDTGKLEEELGDVLFYVVACADALGISLENVARANITKLKIRYPNGFDSAISRARQSR